MRRVRFTTPFDEVEIGGDWFAGKAELSAVCHKGSTPWNGDDPTTIEDFDVEAVTIESVCDSDGEDREPTDADRAAVLAAIQDDIDGGHEKILTNDRLWEDAGEAEYDERAYAAECKRDALRDEQLE